MAGTSLDRRKILGCANPNCPFRVCPDPELGGFCCISCYESFTYGVELTHTNRCQQSRAASWLPRAPPEAPKAILSSSGPGAQHSSPIAAAPIRAPILRGSVATLIAPAADTRPIVSPAVVRPAAPAVVRPAAPAVVRPAAPVVVRPAAPVVVAPAAPVVAPAAPVVVAPAAPIVTPAKIIAPRKRLAPGGPLGSVAKSRARPKASWMEGSAPIKAWSNIYSVPTWMVSHEDLEEAMPEVEDEIVQEDCDGGHLPDTGKLSFSLGAVFEATDVYEVDPTLDEIELPTPKAPPKAKAPLLTPAQVPAANRDAEETVVFELEELEELQETPEIVRILPCDDDDRQLDYAGMRVEALARAEARMAFGLFTAADLKYLRKNLKKRPPVGFTLFRDEASQELRSVCRTCLQVCRSPAMSCAATPAMRAEQTETSPTVVSSGPVSVTKQEEDMMMARLLREINETNGAASAAATVISPARLGLAVSLAPSGTLL